MKELGTCAPYSLPTILENGVLKLLSLLQSPKKGISSVLDAALVQPDISGVYLFSGKGRTINSSALSHNSKLAHEPWTTSYNLFMQS
uniref:Uncharacterized protein n=1 Tax=Quercus lobata TaxID=97700 RepID=A0A7N2N7F2_QUELO